MTIRDFDAELKGIEQEFRFRFRARNYVARPADAGTAIDYQNATTNAVVYKNGKPTGTKDLANLKLLLLSRTVTEIVQHAETKDDMEVKIKPEAFRAWPHKILSETFDWIMENSGLREESKERQQLFKAFALEGCPANMEDLQLFISELDEEEYGDLQALFRRDEGELAKNG